MKKQQFSDYYLGFDIGTNSVGWCVTDLNYNILKFNKKNMWGSRLFDEAKTAMERRIQRNTRRRLKRRKWRLNLLEEFFSEEILKIDSNFFRRLKESSLWLEDKSSKEKFTLFNDDNYKDYDFYKQYPTIFHLRNELVKNPEKKDIRLVFLAIHSIFKNRGHFLFEGQNLEEIKNFETLFNNLISFLEDNNINKKIDKNNMKRLKEIICSPKKSIKEKEIKEMFGSDKQLVSFFKLCVGYNVSLNNLFETDEYEKEKISFKEQIYEEVKPTYYSLLGEKIEFLDIAKSFYDFMILTNILDNMTYISDAKVKKYEEHKEDLKNLKYFLKKYAKDDYKKIFTKNEEKLKNYTAYIGLNKVNNKKEVLKEKKIKIDDLSKLIKDCLSKIDNIDSADKAIYMELLNKAEQNTLLPKLRITDNGTLPYQVHEIELKKILENQAKHYEFLNNKEDGITVKDKILMTFKFKIPYYVGTLNFYHKNKSKNSWVVRKEKGKILAWNFDKKVDIERSAEEFIKRMTNKCTYLNGEDVIPNDSFLYSEYVILNELNKIRINGKFLNVENKQKVIDNLFKKQKRITEKAFKEFLLKNNIIDNIKEIEGILGSFNSNYNSYIKFETIFGNKLDLELYKEIAENSILWKCLYGDDKKIFEKKIKSIYGDILTEEEIKNINSLKFNSWGRLSKKLLTEIEFSNLETGEHYSSIMNALRKTNYNLMELMTPKFDLEKSIDNENKETNNFSYKELIENSYVSPSIKRAIFQTIKIYEEIKKITGKIPKKVFIEMARGGDETMKSKKIPARQEQIKKLYDNCKKEVSNFSIDIKGLKETLKSYSNNDLKQKKLYLYFLQLGKCLYSGEKIDLNTLLKNNDIYDIDHIYPRSKIVKDDNFDNLALVLKTENAKKSDKFPLNENIQTKMKKFWYFLKENNFISAEKYKRLTETSQVEIKGFLARQLVSVRQSTKEIGKILQQIEPEIKIVYSKAEIATSFREMFDFTKVRELNDSHHAKDAYLNIVAGNVYNTKFTKKPYRYLKDTKENYDVKKIYNYNIKNAWDKEKSLEIVKKNMEKNTVNITRFIQEEKGQLFNLTIKKKGKTTNEIVPIKPKCYTGNNEKLNEKYGYFQSLEPAYFLFVEHKEKNKVTRSFERITLVDVNKIKEKSDLIEYLIKIKGLIEPKIIKKFYKKQCILIDGFPYLLTGLTSDKNLELKNNKPLYLEKEYEKILKNSIRFYEDNFGNSEEKYKYIFLKKKDRFEKQEAITSVKERYNTQFNKMYDKFLEKLNSKEYKKYMNSQKYQILLEKKKDFLKLNLLDKAYTLRAFLKLFTNETNGDFSKLKLSATLGRLNGKSSNAISKNELYLFEESITGLFAKKIKLN